MSLVAVLILLAAHTAPATAQQKAQTVSGTVLDPDGNPLIGATVVVVKGTQGAVTDVKANSPSRPSLRTASRFRTWVTRPRP